MSRHATAAIVFFLAFACGGRPETPAANAPQAASRAAVPEPAGDDFVPPDAQARAEEVLNAAFNRDKTTRLQMRMTTLVARTSALEGFSTAIAPRQDSIEDRLSRLNARVTETEVVVQLPGAILFDFDSAAIRPDAERALHDVQQVIAAFSGRPVRVEGHTDSVAGDDYNLKLSQARAASVAKWLAANGVEPARISAAGLGESKPAASNDTSEGRQKNRRVEIIIARK